MGYIECWVDEEKKEEQEGLRRKSKRRRRRRKRRRFSLSTKLGIMPLAYESFVGDTSYQATTSGNLEIYIHI